MRLVVLVVILFARSAAATGVCENLPRHYDPPRLYSEAEDAFAVFASQDWCDEVERGGALDEVRGKVHFVELRDTRGTVLGILSSARGKDAQRVTDLIGVFEPVSPAKLPGVLKARGYLPLTSSGPKPRRCSVRTAWRAAPKETVNGFPAATLSVEVLAGGKRVTRVELGLAARDRKPAAIVRAQWLPKRSAVAVWAIVPSCSGPPPGYFGADDPGSCYEVDSVALTVIEATATPEIVACFP
jgi:hypothetical protein